MMKSRPQHATDRALSNRVLPRGIGRPPWIRHGFHRREIMVPPPRGLLRRRHPPRSPLSPLPPTPSPPHRICSTASAAPPYGLLLYCQPPPLQPPQGLLPQAGAARHTLGVKRAWSAPPPSGAGEIERTSGGAKGERTRTGERRADERGQARAFDFFSPMDVRTYFKQ